MDLSGHQSNKSRAQPGGPGPAGRPWPVLEMAAEEQLLAQLEAARAEVAALEAALDVAQLPTASTAAVLPQPLQYSPLFSDRATNWMTQEFGDALRELSATLRQVYHADSVAFIPGAGSYGMEAAARQFGQDRVCASSAEAPPPLHLLPPMTHQPDRWSFAIAGRPDTTARIL